MSVSVKAYSSIEDFLKDADPDPGAEERMYAARRAQPKSYRGNRPTPEEEPAELESYVPSPCCPGCGNVDPRALLDDSVLPLLHAEAGHEGEPRKIADVPTSMHGTLDASDWEYTSSQFMYCLACPDNVPTRFEFRPSTFMFNPEMGPLNMARASKAYLARMLYDQADKPEKPENPDKPEKSKKKVDVKVSVRKRAREGGDADGNDRIVSVTIKGVGRMRAAEVVSRE